jgi:hypothetical protein
MASHPPRHLKLADNTPLHTKPLDNKPLERAETAASWISGLGLEVVGLHRFLLLWRRLGFVGTLLAFIVIGVPATDYSLLSIAANRTVPRLAGDFGVDFQAEWSYRPLSLAIVARNVSIRPEHPANAPAFFTASEIEFQGSVSSVIHTLWDAARLHPLQTFNEITVRHGVLRLERSIQGDLNVNDFWNSVDPDRRADLLSGAFHANAISFEDGRIEYTEHLAGDSGSGVLQMTEAKIFVDSITGSLFNVRRLETNEVTSNQMKLPTRLMLAGRVAEGTIDARGDLGLLTANPWPVRPASDTQYRAVATTARPADLNDRPGPYYVVRIRVDNIGAAAFTRAVPNLDVVATQGTIQGTIEVADNAPCRGDAFATNVKFGPNPMLKGAPGRLERMRRVSDTWNYTGTYSPCSSLAPAGESDTDTAGRTMRAATSGAAGLVLAFNHQATATAPPAIRAAVARDTQRVTGLKVADAALGDTTDAVANELGNAATRLVGARTGGVVKQSLQGSPASQPGTPTENPLTKGAKGIGHGLKRLIGKK